MNILVAVDENYLDPLKVTLYSIAKHNSVPIRVYVLHFHISEKKQREFAKSVRKNIEVKFFRVRLEEFNGIAQNKRYKLEANLRLAMLKVLPSDIERIMWLDADIIVRKNILEFYNYPDKGQCAIVCEDMFSRSEKYDILQNLGMKCSSRYFNSGVMLFYLKNVRKFFNEETFLLWAKQNPDKLKFPDQNVLNSCLEGKVIWADPRKYNLQLLRINKQVLKHIYSSKVVHYNMPQKPWNDNYDGDGEWVYWTYAIKAWGIVPFFKHYLKKYIGRER